MMRSLLLIAFFSTAALGGTDSDDNKDGCTFDAHVGASVFDAKSSKLSKYLGVKDVPYDFTESAILADGTTVTYETGGCAHMGYSFSYQGVKAPRGADAQALISLAQKLLDATPENSGSHQRDSFLHALAKASKARPALKNGVVDLPCDDPETCQLTLAGDKVSLSLDSGL